MNVGIFADDKAKTGINENNFYVGKVPMIINSYSVIDECGAGDDVVNGIKNCIDRIKTYYNNNFAIYNAVSSKKNRNNKDCKVIIREDRSVEINYIEYIDKKLNEVNDILEKINVDGKNAEYIRDYLMLLKNKNLSD